MLNKIMLRKKKEEVLEESSEILEGDESPKAERAPLVELDLGFSRVDLLALQEAVNELIRRSNG